MDADFQRMDLVAPIMMQNMLLGWGHNAGAMLRGVFCLLCSKRCLWWGLSW